MKHNLDVVLLRTFCILYDNLSLFENINHLLKCVNKF